MDGGRVYVQKKAYVGNCAQQFDNTSVQPSQPLWTDFKGIAIQLLCSVYNSYFRFVNVFS